MSALAEKDPNTWRYGEEVRPGFYKIREHRNGLWLAAKVQEIVPLDPWTGDVLDRWYGYEAFINGHPANEFKVTMYGRPIGEDEYRWLIALNAIQS